MTTSSFSIYKLIDAMVQLSDSVNANVIESANALNNQTTLLNTGTQSYNDQIDALNKQLAEWTDAGKVTYVEDGKTKTKDLDDPKAEAMIRDVQNQISQLQSESNAFTSQSQSGIQSKNALLSQDKSFTESVNGIITKLLDLNDYIASLSGQSLAS
ncbi:MAG: hypothetical protein JSS61_05420 [Verrucomicrobia bacterium]|nr:hypothetical protein [Verrucomicrobiota bacterium]